MIDKTLEALERLMPLFEKSMRELVFTAEKAGEVTADMNTLRAALAAPSAEPVAWLLTDEKINDLQATSVSTLVARAKHAHFCNVHLRVNGKDELYEADWLKHLEGPTDGQLKTGGQRTGDCAAADIQRRQATGGGQASAAGIGASLGCGNAAGPQEVGRAAARQWPGQEPLSDAARIAGVADVQGFAAGGVVGLRPARTLTDELMDCVDRLGSESGEVDPRVWDHLLVYAPEDQPATPAQPPAAQHTAQSRLSDELSDLYSMGFSDGSKQADDPETNEQRRAAAINLVLGRLTAAEPSVEAEPVRRLVDAAMAVISRHDEWVRQMPAGAFDDPLSVSLAALHDAAETVGISLDIAAPVYCGHGCACVTQCGDAYDHAGKPKLPAKEYHHNVNPIPPLDPPQASAEPYRLTKEEQQHMRNALLRSVKVVDGPDFELWWETHMPAATQEQAWRAFTAASHPTVAHPQRVPLTVEQISEAIATQVKETP